MSPFDGGSGAVGDNSGCDGQWTRIRSRARRRCSLILKTFQSLGVRVRGASLHATLAAQERRGLTALRLSGGTLFLPHVDASIGTRLPSRIWRGCDSCPDRPERTVRHSMFCLQTVGKRCGLAMGGRHHSAAGRRRSVAGGITRRSALVWRLARGHPIVLLINTFAGSVGVSGWLDWNRISCRQAVMTPSGT